MMRGPTEILRCPECACLLQRETLYSWNTFDNECWTDGGGNYEPFVMTFGICLNCASGVWIDEAEKVCEYMFGIDGYEEKIKKYLLTDFLCSGNEQAYREELLKQPMTIEKSRYLRINLWQHGNDKRRKVQNLKKQILYYDNEDFENALEALKKLEKVYEENPDVKGLDRWLEDLKLRCSSKKKREQHEKHLIDLQELKEVGAKHPVPLSDEERENLELLYQLLDDSNETELFIQGEVLRELGRFEEAKRILNNPFSDVGGRLVETVRQLITDRKFCVAAIGADTLVADRCRDSIDF